jgi:hypothetical protein
MYPMTEYQRRRIFGLIRELGWSEEIRRDMLTDWVGKPSLAADADEPITETEARRVLDELRNQVMHARYERRLKGQRQRRVWNPARLTPEQLFRIEHLRWEVYGHDVPAFRDWLRKRYDVERSDQLSEKQAIGCIVGLEKMKEVGWKPHPSGFSAPPPEGP